MHNMTEFPEDLRFGEIQETDEDLILDIFSNLRSQCDEYHATKGVKESFLNGYERALDWIFSGNASLGQIRDIAADFSFSKPQEHGNRTFSPSVAEITLEELKGELDIDFERGFHEAVWTAHEVMRRFFHITIVKTAN